MYNLEFDRALFWDIDPETLDIKKHAGFVIQRVLKKGSLDDWLTIKEIYGLDQIKKESLSIRSLDKKTLSFLSNYFDVEKTEFRCYN